MLSAENFIDAVRARSRTLDPALPAIADQRRTSVVELQRIGMPTGKIETWKYTPIRDFYAPPFAMNVDSPTTLPRGDTGRFLTFSGAQAILMHGAQPDYSAVSIRHGVDFTNLSTAAAMPRPPRLNAGVDLNRYQLAHLNTALLEDGLIIRIAAGIDAGALDLRFFSNSNGANISRVRVEIGAGSTLRLIEQHAEDRPTNSVLEIDLAPRATLEHTRVLPPTTPPCWYLVSVNVAAEATYSLAGYATGSKVRRTDIHVRLDGHHAKTDINLACVTHGRDRLDHQIVVEHIGVDTVSRQIVHGIAAGDSELTFNGRIHIHPGAQRSDARLTNKNLLLDRKARINTKPELEIYANDVKCSHGATVGQIDPAQMFYLRARGIDEHTARTMLMRAFLSSRLTAWAREAGVETIYEELFR